MDKQIIITVDYGKSFITSTELQDSSRNAQTDFGLYDTMKAVWNYFVPAGTDIKVGNTVHGNWRNVKVTLQVSTV